MVKTGSAWAGSFVTLDATGALATPSSGPAGVLYVDGAANGATVTITGSNPYKWAVTLPSLTAGQRVDMYITATIATIATAGFVASDQADTVLLSEVKTETAAILADTGTDGVKVAASVLTITDSVPADGSLPTVNQALYMIWQFLSEKSVSGTTLTVKKADGSTSLMTFTLDDADTPNSITRAS